MAWVGAMNNFKARAEEIVYRNHVRIIVQQ